MLPADQPAVTFVTPIYHANIDTSGHICPALLFGAGWTPSNTLRGLLLQTVNVLNDPDPDSPIRPDLCSLLTTDRAAYVANAAKQAMEKAGGGEQFSKKAAGAAPAFVLGDNSAGPISGRFLEQRAKAHAEKTKKDGVQNPPPLPDWPHDYLLIEGDFGKDGEGREIVLPRIKLVFREATAPVVAPVAAPVAALAPAPAAVATAAEPCAPDVEAAVMGMVLELDGALLTVVGCYKLQPERVALYAESLAPGLTVANAVAVICTDESGATVETVVNAETKEHVIFEDPIMMSELALPTLAEAQFVEGGAWTVAGGGVDMLDMEKKVNFATYDKTVSAPAPECLSTLRSYLQSGPVTRLYSGGGDGKFVPIHAGFTLRMPKGEVGDWSGVNDKGKPMVISRPAVALRVWDAAGRAYAPYDSLLAGAPATPAETDAWFVALVKKLKNSPYLGEALLDALVTSTRTADMQLVDNRTPENMAEALEKGFEGTFSNRWAELVISTHP